MEQRPSNSSSGVEIIEEGGAGSWGAVKYYRQDEPPRLIQFVLKNSNGLVKDAQQATKVLWVFALMFFALAIVIVAINFFDFGSKRQQVNQIYQEDIPLELRTPERLQRFPHRPIGQ